MVDSPTSIVLLGSNRNRVGSTSSGRCSSSWLISLGAQIGAFAGIMSLLHSCNTYDQLIVGPEQLEPFEYSDSQQQESGDCWGVESFATMG
jgi:hypothetical protein